MRPNAPRRCERSATELPDPELLLLIIFCIVFCWQAPTLWDAPARETREPPPANARARTRARTLANRLLFLCIFYFLPCWAIGTKPPTGGGAGGTDCPEATAHVRSAGDILKRLKKRFGSIRDFPGREQRRGEPAVATCSARRGFRKVHEKNIKPRWFCMDGATTTPL